jgi:hypothetical protein
MRIALMLAGCLIAAGCGGGSAQPNGTCTFNGQTFTEFVECPGSTVCCPTFDHCAVIVGGGYSCVSN